MGPEQAIDAGGHEGPGLLPGQGLAHAGGVAAQQIELELGQLVRGDHHRGELAEAGVDAVDRAAFVQDVLDHLAVFHYPVQGGRIQGDMGATGDARQGAGVKASSGKADHGGSWGVRRPPPGEARRCGGG